MTTHRERALGAARADLRRRPHRHDWWYAPPSVTGTGYGLIRCGVCGRAKFYA